MEKNTCNDLQTTISHALHEMEVEAGKNLDPAKVNLAELERRTGISRKRLRKLKKQEFIVMPHGSLGHKSKTTKISRFGETIDDYLRKGIKNSNLIFERIKDDGYNGGLTRVKNYITEHSDLIPPKRLLVASQGNRGRRFETEPGESYQMDWGFLNVENSNGVTWRACCFAMICHHCSRKYIEFFPNAKQESLFIGMIHGFLRLGVPEFILTDNMKSVSSGRDVDGYPLWNKEYESFMNAVGFRTKLCKPRHPFTKGKVERLIQFVKTIFAAGRLFGNISDLNFEAISWCDKQDSNYRKDVDGIPQEIHSEKCMCVAHELEMNEEILKYLWPSRTISFDGFVSYENRRFGVPYWYTQKTCRISRQEYRILLYSEDLKEHLTEYDVTWSRKDQFCYDQYGDEMPEEYPTAPVTTIMRQKELETRDDFSRFNFDREVQR